MKTELTLTVRNGASKLSDFIAACEIVAAGKGSALLALGSHFKDKEMRCNITLFFRPKRVTL